MYRFIRTALLASLLLSFPGQANAQIAGREASPMALALGQCVVGMTTGNDRVLVARWLGSSISSSPELADVVKVDQAAREAIDREMANLFVRLFTQDCFDEARPIVLANDLQSVEMAFGMLGEVAMRELMTDPLATQAMTSYANHIPPDVFDVFLEGGK